MFNISGVIIIIILQYYGVHDGVSVHGNSFQRNTSRCPARRSVGRTHNNIVSVAINVLQSGISPRRQYIIRIRYLYTRSQLHILSVIYIYIYTHYTLTSTRKSLGR